MVALGAAVGRMPSQKCASPRYDARTAKFRPALELKMRDRPPLMSTVLATRPSHTELDKPGE